MKLFLSRRNLRVLSLLSLSAVAVLSFQNCAGFKSASPSAIVAVYGKGGEYIQDFEPQTIYSGGGRLVVHGKDFTSATTIEIDSQPCPDLQLISPGELSCTAPAASAGSKMIVVAGTVLPRTLDYVDFSRIVSVAGRAGVTGTADGFGRLARSTYVRDLVVDGDYAYFVEGGFSYLGLHAVRRMDLGTTEVVTLAGGPEGGYADGTGAEAKFAYPMGVVKYGESLYIADQDNCVIRKLDLATRAVTTVAGVAAACSLVDGDTADVRLEKPGKMAVWKNDLYFADGNTIRKMDLRTGAVVTVAGGESLTIPDSAGWTADVSQIKDEMVLAAPVETPHDYEVGKTYTFELRQPGAKTMIVHFEKFATEAGYDIVEFQDAQGHSLFKMDGDLGMDVRSLPIAGDYVKVVFTSDVSNVDYGFKIDKIVYSNSDLPPLHSTDGPALTSPVGSVEQMVIAGGALYFMDSALYLVRKLDFTSGTLTGLVGKKGSARNIGRYDTTELYSPEGLAADAANLYISDFGDSRILRVNMRTREISLVFQADYKAGDPATIDGPFASASIRIPGVLAYDSRRGLYFESRDVIRRIK